ncbi:hypothetical protein ACH42_09760 [Endozoicomonas sp. (ex Bugula neritina AB1)]|nr:hypothetical protein ACH42_09760 [Endozoicomonas sp. (ex Bugula neritina AB1)]
MTSTKRSNPDQKRGRKSVDAIAAQMGVSSQQELIWQQVRHLRQFTISDLQKAITRQCRGMNESAINAYLIRLTNGGYLEKEKSVNGSGHKKWLWTLVKDSGVETPKLKINGEPSAAGRAKEQLWRTMKVISEFNYFELSAAASTEVVPVAVGTAKAYIRSLHQAGYLVKIRKGKTGNPARYRTVPTRIRGPKPPMVLRNKAVFDQNLMQVMEPVND